jgi:hypothetical protein
MFGSTALTTGATSFATNGTFTPNLKAAGISAGITALFAGIEGGIRAANNNRNFWTGEIVPKTTTEYSQVNLPDYRRGYGMSYNGPGEPITYGPYTLEEINVISTRIYTNKLIYATVFYYGLNTAPYDFVKNYIQMRQANFEKADKYFHCKANYEASLRGPGGRFFARHFSNLRETFDMRIKGDLLSDALEDQAANIHGRQQITKVLDACKACEQFRPPGLPKKYW